jgi:hypothetical protein
MKKILLITAFLISIIAISISCKKGANDPFFSIRSRDSRIVGIWKIHGISIDSTVTTISSLKDESSTFHTTYSYDSLRIFSAPNGNTRDSVYKEILTINEDGTFTDSISSKKNGATIFKLRVVKNEWYWTTDKKNKDGIVLQGYGTYKLDRLAWKELILISNRENVNYSNKTLSYGSNVKVTKVLTFKRS